MALSSAQKFQFLRLPVVGAGVTSSDKFALLGVVPPASSLDTLTSAQRRQILRLPVVSASITTADKFAILGLMQSADTGAIVDFFETEWFVDPTWVAQELPASNYGSVLTSLNGFSIAFYGARGDAPDVIAPNAGTTIANTNATTHPSSLNVCQISGFRAARGQLTQRWDGVYCLPEYNNPREEQDFVRPRAEKLRGSVRPEPPDRFVGTISASDL
jgi:hypothetical protein